MRAWFLTDVIDYYTPHMHDACVLACARPAASIEMERRAPCGHITCLCPNLSKKSGGLVSNVIHAYACMRLSSSLQMRTVNFYLLSLLTLYIGVTRTLAKQMVHV